MFLLRCAFWLSVVYASMYFGSPFRSLGGGAAASQPRAQSSQGRPMPAAQAAPDTLAERLAGQATAGMAALCAGRELDCVRDAAKLTALVQTAIAGAPDYAAQPAQQPAPMPVPDPRRHGMLTR